MIKYAFKTNIYVNTRFKKK